METKSPTDGASLDENQKKEHMEKHVYTHIHTHTHTGDIHPKTDVFGWM